jgi:competence protein ComEA
MRGLPTKRLLFYCVAGVVVLAVGLFSLLSRGSAADTGAAAGGVVLVPPTGVVSTTTSTSKPNIFVQVSGEVGSPGVYEIPAESRLFELLDRAGGVTAAGDRDALPLAQMLSDGARVVVPKKGETPAEAAVGTVTGIVEVGAVGGGSGGGSVSVSRASAAELESLPGIGPVTAANIISFREEHGPFASVDDLQLVPGIGPATVERLRNLVVP